MDISSTQPILLVIEDSDEDFETLRRTLRKASFTNPVVRHANGDDALRWLRSNGQNGMNQPTGMILLDLNLPGTDGRDILEIIKKDQVLRTLPVVVLTTSGSPSDVEICYRRGANSYMIKSLDLQVFQRSVSNFCEYWFKVVTLPRRAVAQ